MAQSIDIQIERSLTNTPSLLLYGEPAWDDSNQKLYVGSSDGTPVLINPDVSLSFSDLTDGSSQTPNSGEILAWDGSNYAPSDSLILDQDGCSIQTINDTGLDWCNHQIGTSGSAFTVLRKSLGTIASPTALVNGTKIGGWGFSANDGSATSYIGAEISSYVTEDQSATNGGAEMRFLVTETGTKNTFNAFTIENDGTLNVAGQTDYEDKVTLDDHIPNKKYVDDLIAGTGVASDMASIQLRRSTVYNVINGSYGSVTFDQTDVETDSTVIELNSTDTSQVDIKETGTYLITYTIHSDGTDSSTDFRVLLNDTSVLEGSQSIRNESGDSNRATVGATIVASLTQGNNIKLQTQTNVAGVVLDPPIVFSIVRLKGAKGDKGDAGVDGAQGEDGTDGQAGFGIYAWAETNADASQLDGSFLTATSSAAGIYNYSFDSTAPNATYTVFVQPVYGANQNAIEAEVYDKSTNGFTIRLNRQDDGAGSGTNLNVRHSVVVIGPGSGLPAGSITKGTVADNQFVFFDGNELEGNSVLTYSDTENNININSDINNTSGLNINALGADSDWLSFTYQNNYSGGFFGLDTDPGEMGLILGEPGAQSTIIYGGLINTVTGYQIANTALSLYHLGDTTTSTQTPSDGDVLRWNGTAWDNEEPNITAFAPGTIRVASQGADQTANYNNATTTIPVVLSGTVTTTGSGATYFTNSNGTVTCNFDGAVKVYYGLPHFSTGARAHLKSLIQLNGTDYGSAAYSYIRDASNHRRDSNQGCDIISVNTGDTIRIGARRGEESNVANAITLEANCTLVIERIE